MPIILLYTMRSNGIELAFLPWNDCWGMSHLLNKLNSKLSQDTLWSYVHIGLFRWFCGFPITKLEGFWVLKPQFQYSEWALKIAKIFNLDFIIPSFSVFFFLEMHLDARHVALPSFNLMASENFSHFSYFWSFSLWNVLGEINILDLYPK